MRKLLQGGGGELVNYDYYDIAEGTGIKNFYAAQSYASGGAVTAFLTTDNTQYSDKIAEKIKSIGDSSVNIGSSLNYDAKFNLPKTIYGIAKCSFSQGVIAPVYSDVWLKLSLYHYNGTTSILMASGASILTNKTGGSLAETKNIPFDLTKQKWQFKKGDILRMTAVLYERCGNTSCYAAYGCDPQDRDDVVDASGAAVITAGLTTQLKLAVPFILDL